MFIACTLECSEFLYIDLVACDLAEFSSFGRVFFVDALEFSAQSCHLQIGTILFFLF